MGEDEAAWGCGGLFLLVWMLPFIGFSSWLLNSAAVEECRKSLEYLKNLEGTTLMIRNALIETIKTCEVVAKDEEIEKVWYTNLKLVKDEISDEFGIAEVTEIKIWLH